jgi:hypothetical protein
VSASHSNFTTVEQLTLALLENHPEVAATLTAELDLDLMRQLEATEKDADGKEKFMLLPDGWNKKPTELTFPEQNGKLLIAMRRYQSRIARLHRWCWFLKGEDKQQKSAWEDIGECEDTRLVSAEQRAKA